MFSASEFPSELRLPDCPVIDLLYDTFGIEKDALRYRTKAEYSRSHSAVGIESHWKRHVVSQNHGLRRGSCVVGINGENPEGLWAMKADVCRNLGHLALTGNAVNSRRTLKRLSDLTPMELRWSHR